LRSMISQSLNLNRTQLAVIKISDQILRTAYQYFATRGFLNVSTSVPHITAATGSCEDFSTVFELRYFDRVAFLAQTEQLYLEMLLPSLGRVWCHGPSFRAEPAVDLRHLTEFHLLEFEDCCGFEQLLLCIEELIWEMQAAVLSTNRRELNILGARADGYSDIGKHFPRVSYQEAVNALGLSWGSNLTREHEKSLVESCGNEPLFVTHFPVEIKFFNMRKNATDPRVVNSVDLILPFSGEAAGGAEREYEFDVVANRLQKSKMYTQSQERGASPTDFDFYLNYLRRFGSPPHAGAGIGLNRVVQFLCGFEDIRSSTIFPLNSKSIF
jgi:asparaginyl-tRNA synthetase